MKESIIINAALLSMIIIFQINASVLLDCNSTEVKPYHDVFSGYCNRESLGAHSDTENQHKDSNFVSLFES